MKKPTDLITFDPSTNPTNGTSLVVQPWDFGSGCAWWKTPETPPVTLWGKKTNIQSNTSWVSTSYRNHLGFHHWLSPVAEQPKWKRPLRLGVTNGWDEMDEITPGFQTPNVRRCLGPKNIPKTPSHEVFGRLGLGDFYFVLIKFQWSICIFGWTIPLILQIHPELPEVMVWYAFDYWLPWSFGEKSPCGHIMSLAGNLSFTPMTFLEGQYLTKANQ